ncbi:MAG: argininosuccinate lyase [Thermoplasmata archaeon]|jgi:argininosuccinate lyase|nr:argininosuccinate lyase [Thermoplasmata archaeon]
MSRRSAGSSPKPTSDEFTAFTASVDSDRRLWKYDIAGSIAHARGLADAKVLSEKEFEEMRRGLRKIAARMRKGDITLDMDLEDIHMNVERMLVSEVGGLGEKLHTGRSRNDQVALDARLYTRDALARIIAEASALQEVMLTRASDVKGAVMPGYTHMQRAQPVLLSHHLLAHFWRLQRDISRLCDCYGRANVSPLGAGALAGTAFGIDREVAAGLLRMGALTENSLDAVSDRDFAAESAFALSLLMVHLSSLSEELVIWSSKEFGFVRLPPHLSSGSSMMPQKRNPDIPELVRGKTGRAIGDLIAILTVLKSLPLAYNRDLQEDKENLYDVFDTVGASLHALRVLLDEIEFDTVRMGKSAGTGLMTATDLADFLSNKGMTFRAAHALVKDIAERSGGDDKRFIEIALQTLPDHVEGFDPHDLDGLTPEGSVRRRECEGGTAPASVAAQMRVARMSLENTRMRLGKMQRQVAAVDELLWP